MKFSSVWALFAALATTALAATATTDDNTVFLKPSNPGVQPTGVIVDPPNQLDINGNNATYNFPMKMFEFDYWGHHVEIAFLISKPCCTSNGKYILMLHGKNYFCNTWKYQIDYFNDMGYTVLAVDGLCFGKSSKYPGIQLSTNLYCWIYTGLLKALGISKAHLMGHSWGGMQSIHCAYLYPDFFDMIMSLDAVGMEDYTDEKVPYFALDAQLAQEESSTYDSILGYEFTYYFPNMTMPWLAYQTAQELAWMYGGSHRRNYTQCQAMIVDLVLSNTIINDYVGIYQPFLLMVGEVDHTIIGIWASADVKANLGNFPKIGETACNLMHNCTLVIFEGEGHSTQVKEPEKFDVTVGMWLETVEP